MTLFLNITMYPQHLNLSINNDNYEISYKCADFQVEDTIIEYKDGKKVFSYLKFDNDEYDYITDSASPEIPFISFNFRLPDNADSAYIEIINAKMESYALPHLYLPTIIRDGNSKPLSFDYVATCNNKYRDCSKTLCLVSPVYTMIGCKGVTVTIYPFECSYDNVDDEEHGSIMNYITEATFKLSYTKGENKNGKLPVAETLQGINDSVENLAMLSFDNYRYIPPKSIAAPTCKYLIITESRYQSYLSSFVNYKDSLGYDVNIVTTTTTKTNSDSIRNYLVWYYKQNPDLRYVLLVGDLNHIPFSYGIKDSDTNPPTDLYYSCLDYYDINHQTDLHPDVFVGRWLVNNITNLSKIIAKTIRTERNLYGVDDSAKYVGLFSGKGDHDYLFYKRNTQLKNNIFRPYNYTYINVDGRVNDSPTQLAIQNALRGSLHYLWILIYSGHASVSYGFGAPYYVNSSIIVDSINNHSLPYQPFAISEGCETANIFYSSSYNFVNKWLCDINENGGVGLLASTVTTYSPPVQIYTEKIFNQMKDSSHPNMAFGAMCSIGGSNYYHSDMVAYRKNMYKKMIYFGDPSLMINGNSVSNPIHMKKFNDIETQLNDVYSDLDNNIANIKVIHVFSVSGKLIKSYNTYNDFWNNNLSYGLYIVKVNMSDGFITYRYYKH